MYYTSILVCSYLYVDIRVERHIHLRGPQVVLMMCQILKILKIIYMFSENIEYNVWPT